MNKTTIPPSPGRGLPWALAALALLLTGCPHNEYLVRLEPRGEAVERTLTFYCTDGVDTNGNPKYETFATNELAAIAAVYPAQGLTNAGGRHVLHGLFTNALPADVGGAGAYRHWTTSLGGAGFYEERFRGNDDLAGLAQRRAQAADQLADLMIGWSRRELWREPGCKPLRQFLDGDFRRDLRNLGDYWWAGGLISNYKTNADEEFVVRFGQYLCERGYFKIGELPGLFSDFNRASGPDSAALLRRIQRLVAAKMGVPATNPVPAALAFLGDERALQTSLDHYLADTDLYRAKLRQWEAARKLKPDTKRPEPADVAGDAVETLLALNHIGGTPDHLTVQLSLPSAPVHGNGHWDETPHQVVWDADLGDRTNGTHLPVACYASWVQPDAGFQTAHFGRVALTGDNLAQYCLWRSSLEAQPGGEWDAFLAGLKPGPGLLETLVAFRFPGEPMQAATNAPPAPSAWPRDLLTAALKQFTTGENSAMPVTQ
jgi:hypothetical protein